MVKQLYCPECGSLLTINAKFCQNCGCKNENCNENNVSANLIIIPLRLLIASTRKYFDTLLNDNTNISDNIGCAYACLDFVNAYSSDFAYLTKLIQACEELGDFFRDIKTNQGIKLTYLWYSYAVDFASKDDELDDDSNEYYKYVVQMEYAILLLGNDVEKYESFSSIKIAVNKIGEYNYVVDLARIYAGLHPWANYRYDVDLSCFKDIEKAIQLYTIAIPGLVRRNSQSDKYEVEQMINELKNRCNYNYDIPANIMPQNSYQTPNNTGNLVISLLLCLFLGNFGAHKFYEGNIGMGVLYLFTFGLLGIGTLVDLIKIIIEMIGSTSSYSGGSITSYSMPSTEASTPYEFFVANSDDNQSKATFQYNTESEFTPYNNENTIVSDENSEDNNIFSSIGKTHYDSQGDYVGHTDNEGNVFDKLGNKAGYTDTNRVTYDSLGNLKSYQTEDGYVYDNCGNRVGYIDQDGNHYDNLGNLKGKSSDTY